MCRQCGGLPKNAFEFLEVELEFLQIELEFRPRGCALLVSSLFNDSLPSHSALSEEMSLTIKSTEVSDCT